jgi:Isochorismatase family
MGETTYFSPPRPPTSGPHPSELSIVRDEAGLAKAPGHMPELEEASRVQRSVHIGMKIGSAAEWRPADGGVRCNRSMGCQFPPRGSLQSPPSGAPHLRHAGWDLPADFLRAAITEACKRLRDRCRAAGVPIAYSRHLSLPTHWLGPFQTRMAMAWQRIDDPASVMPWFLRGAPGFELVPERRRVRF